MFFKKLSKIISKFAFLGRYYFMGLVLVVIVLIWLMAPKNNPPASQVEGTVSIIGDTATFSGENFIGSNTDFDTNGSKGIRNIVVEPGAKVFVNGDHSFGNITIKDSGSFGTTGINDNFLVKWTGYIRVQPSWKNIRLVGEDAVKLRLRPLNGQWLEASAWTNNCGSACPSKAEINLSSAGLFEVEAWYYNFGGMADVQLQKLAFPQDNSWFDARYSEPIPANELFTGIDYDHGTACTPKSNFQNGLCGEYYAMMTYYNDPTTYKNIAGYLDDHLTQRRIDKMVNFSWDLADPFERTPDIRSNNFAYLNIYSDGDIVIRPGGVLEMVGGRNGGPYLAETYTYDSATVVNVDYNDVEKVATGRLYLTCRNLYLQSNLIPRKYGVIKANGLSPLSLSNLYQIDINGDRRDGGNGGIIKITTTQNISLESQSQIEAKGGTGSPLPGPNRGGSGGGGSGGIVKISAGNSLDNSGRINVSGGNGGDGSGVKSMGRPGRSWFSLHETQFYGNPMIVSDCWQTGGDCGENDYHTLKTSNPPNIGSTCGVSGEQTFCSSDGGWYGKVWGRYGSLGAGGGGGYCPGMGSGKSTQGGGGGGGAGGVVIVNAASVSDQNSLTDSSFLGARGGNGGKGADGPAGGLGGVAATNLLNNRYDINDALEISKQAQDGQCGSHGDQAGGSGGGGAGPVLNYSLIVPPTPLQGLTIEGDVHAAGNISISGYATGIASAGGIVNYSNSGFRGNLGDVSSYTINSESLASWGKVVTSGDKSYFQQVLKRLKLERALPFLKRNFEDLNPNMTPEGGVYLATSSFPTQLMGYKGRGTVIIERGGLEINGDYCWSNEPTDFMGFIVESGDVIIQPNTSYVKAAIFAPNSDIRILKSNKGLEFHGLMVAKSITIKPSNMPINIHYDPKINGTKFKLIQNKFYSALPGFSQILPPIWSESGAE